MRLTRYSTSARSVAAGLACLLASLLALAACKQPNDPAGGSGDGGDGGTGQQGGEDDGSAVAAPSAELAEVASKVAPESWWGPYFRLDYDGGLAGYGSYYVASDRVRMGRSRLASGYQYSSSIVSATESEIRTELFSLEKVPGGEGLVKVRESQLSGEVAFYLYPDQRREGIFGGVVARPAAEGARGLASGLGGIQVLIQNINNSADTQTVTTEADGSFNATKAVPGDDYVVAPQTEGATKNAVVQPAELSADVGLVTVSETGYGFKTSVSYEPDFLFASGSAYRVTVTVTNSGKAESPSPIWTLSSPDESVRLAASEAGPFKQELSNNLRTIPAGSSKYFSVWVSCSAISEKYLDKSLAMKLKIYGGPTWEDRLGLRFWKDERMNLSLSSEKGVNAIFISPEGRTIPFSGQLEVPRWASGSSVVVAGAGGYSGGMSTPVASKYALGVDVPSYYDWASTAVDTEVGEPNDIPDEGTFLYVNDPSGKGTLGYLEVGEVDCYRIVAQGLPEPTGLDIERNDASHVDLSWAPVIGADVYHVRLDGVLLTQAAGTTATSLENVECVAKAPRLSVTAYGAEAGYSPAAELVDMPLVRVPGGSFTQTLVDEKKNEIKRQVELSEFYIGKYEVTRAQLEPFFGQSPTGDTAELPASAAWFEAIRFCNLLSMQEGLTPAYSADGSTDPEAWTSDFWWDRVSVDWAASGYRLPTEAEWEWAARGAEAASTFTYAGSDDPATVAWYEDNAQSVVQEVGTKSPNALDVYDMSGNVVEWCGDWDGDFSPGNQLNPRGAASGTKRVRRGGSVESDAASLRVATRLSAEPNTSRLSVGFRVVRVIPGGQVTKIALDRSRAAIMAGQSLKLAANPAPYYADNLAATWSSDNPSVASVGADGTVTAAQAGGIAKIVASIGGVSSPACEIRVVAAEETLGTGASAMTMRGIPSGGLVKSNISNVAPTPIQAFYIGKYEVTQTQFSAFEADLGLSPKSFATVGADNPADRISWCEAITFCNWLSKLHGLSPVYGIEINGTITNDPAIMAEHLVTKSDDMNLDNQLDCWIFATQDVSAGGYRLPSLDEWEYAARGAASNRDALFAGTPDATAAELHRVAWHSAYGNIASNAEDKTHEKGTREPTDQMVYDMTGNVNEWCWEKTDYYKRYYRGGSYGPGPLNIGEYFSEYFYLADDESYPSDVFGFRVARSY